MVLWPETALVGYIPEDTRVFSRAEHIINTAGGFNIIGAPYNDENGKSFNAVFAFGSEKGKYQCKHQNIHKKNHLVPFGEYVPLRSLLSNFFGVLNSMGDFSKGTDENVFDNGEIFVGATICSENFFPDISRRFVLSGAKVLSNHTNDAWFFDTAAAHQHFMMNIFRAVENRKAVIVSANSGISGIIEASGIIIKKTSLSKSALLTGSFLQNDFKTFYTKRGDVFIYVCLVLSVLLLSGMCFLLLKERYFKHKSTFSRK
jgi:apolipoprotein N-acyltransferase